MESYTEGGVRFVAHPMPSNYDEYGISPQGERWSYAFCVIDDFGNSVPVEPWSHYEEGCVPFMAPDYDNPPAVGEPYKYVLFVPNIH